MKAPTVEEIREWSKVDFEELGFEQGDPDPLELLLTRAVEYVESVTGRSLETLESGLEATAAEAVQRRVEQLAFKAQADEVETEADFELISSFSAGSYSESRRGMDEMLKARMVNAWPHLNDLLRRMMTADKWDEWLEVFGVIAPAFEVTEIDWHGTLLVPPITQLGSY